MFRTAVIIKKRDCYDKWDVYDDLFWRMVAIAVAEMADDYRINTAWMAEEYRKGAKLRGNVLPQRSRRKRGGVKKIHIC